MSTETPLIIIFFMCLIQLPVSFIFVDDSWLWPSKMQVIWLLVIALTALSAHFCLAKAMIYAQVTTVVIMDFFRLPLIAGVGIFLYGENLEIGLILGGALMLLANLISQYKPPKKVLIDK